MINQQEKLLARMMVMRPEEVRKAFTEWESHIVGGMDSVRAALLVAGWAQVECAGPVLSDGREVHRVGDSCFVMPMAVHEQRLREAFESRGTETKTTPPGEALASVLCPIDHAPMDKRPVCPNCAKGKAGYKILCTCTECAYEVYL